MYNYGVYQGFKRFAPSCRLCGPQSFLNDFFIIAAQWNASSGIGEISHGYLNSDAPDKSEFLELSQPRDQSHLAF